MRRTHFEVLQLSAMAPPFVVALLVWMWFNIMGHVVGVSGLTIHLEGNRAPVGVRSDRATEMALSGPSPGAEPRFPPRSVRTDAELACRTSWRGVRQSKDFRHPYCCSATAPRRRAP
jgi:hypothetical protein